jgi:pectate lyase
MGEMTMNHKVLVQEGRMTLQGAASSTAPAQALRSAAAPWDTLILSKSGYTTVKIALATSTDSVPRTNLVPNSDVPAIASLNAGVVGYATVGGNTTGGGSVAPTTVKTLADFKAAVSDKNPRVIIVEGTITATSAVQIASNKTIIGKDKNAKIYGGIEMNGVNNVIVRNLNIQGVWPNTGAGDAVAVKGQAHHIWLDHLAIWDAPDGQLDITQAANYVTVSWCKFWYTNASHPHRLNGLISAGGGTQPDDWGKLKVTYHHNWFAELVDQRMPRVMYGEVHVYNNYYTSKGNGYCVGIGSYGSVLVENNYFKGTNNSIEFMYDLYAWITQRGNTFDATTGTGPNLNGKQGSRYETNQPFECKALSTVPYEYPATPTADVPTLVSKYAGPQ